MKDHQRQGSARTVVQEGMPGDAKSTQLEWSPTLGNGA